MGNMLTYQEIPMLAGNEREIPGFFTAGPREGRSVWLLGDRYTYKVTGKQTG